MSKATDPAAKFYIRFGGQGTNYDIFIRNLSLVSPKTGDNAHVVRIKEETPSSIIRVNQLGYLPNARKRASIVLDNGDPNYVPQVEDVLPQVVVESIDDNGFEYPVSLVRHGYDVTAGEYIAVVDFSNLSKSGSYRIRASYDGQIEYSHDFEISSDLYSQLKNDAIDYFYYNRIGDVSVKHAARPDLAREKGANHAGVFSALTKKDFDNTDFAPAKNDYLQLVKDFGEDFSTSITSGWYDAGDYGLYVVNGGISAWTLLNWYERTKTFGTSADFGFGEGSLRYQSASDKKEDIIEMVDDEIRFMIAMQEKSGEFEGMVHHKIHRLKWSDFPSTPAQDVGERKIFPVSTAATLNLAAVAAQAARIYKGLSVEAKDRNTAESYGQRSSEYLKAAQKAWDAADKYNKVYAPNPDWKPGGGPYDDTNLSDEFFWAAAELYITTGDEEKYLNKIFQERVPSRQALKSCNFGFILDENGEKFYGAFSWKDTAGLGVMSLALAPKGISGYNVNADVQNAAMFRLYQSSDVWLQQLKKHGYGTPLSCVESKKYPDKKDTQYPWGSNSFVMNMGIVFGYMYDFTGEKKYLDAVVEGMDYILGRNAMDISYVTGYGERAFKNPHHRVWANQYGPEYPKPAPGAVSGGPNTGENCPFGYSYLNGQNTPPQKAYIDHIQAWSTNEITINWNAPLVWLTAYLDEAANNREDVEIEICVPRRSWMTGGAMTPEVWSEVPVYINPDKSIEEIQFFYAFDGAESASDQNRYENAEKIEIFSIRPITRSISAPSADFKTDDGNYALFAKVYLNNGKTYIKKVGTLVTKKTAGKSTDAEVYLMYITGGPTDARLKGYRDGDFVPVVANVIPSYRDEELRTAQTCRSIDYYVIKHGDDMQDPSSWAYIGSIDATQEEPDSSQMDYDAYLIDWQLDGPGEYIYVIRTNWVVSWWGQYAGGGIEYSQYDVSPVLNYGE
ncbi:MAG TPA: glycoside hydrolase family 9 protein [Spirochaetota bacterium]|nr:glycoside hydrolase family 9 protein [Spirochaetota bacterium]